MPVYNAYVMIHFALVLAIGDIQSNASA